MKRASANQHLDRLEKITAILKSESALTVKNLAAELAISERTLFRDIAILRERGLPIDADKGRGGGVRLHRNWGIGRLHLESQEIIDLLLSLAIAESMNSTLFMNNLASIHHKLIASLSPQQKEKIYLLRQRIHIGSPVSPTVLASFNTNSTQQAIEHDSPIVLSPLHHAFLFSQSVIIHYKDSKNERTKREIEPHYLYLAYPVWYVLAWDKLRQDVRIFRCDRMENVILQEQQFTLKPLHEFDSILSENNVATL